MKKILAVAAKELRQIRRDPLTLVMLLGLPAFMLVLYGYAVNFDVEHVALAVQDGDRSAASRELLTAFLKSRTFDLVADLPADADLPRLLERREARAVLVVPEGYGRDLAAGRVAEVQLLLDGTDSATATTIVGNVTGLLAGVNARLRAERYLGGGATIDFEPRVWYNPELRSSHFLVPGLIGFIMMVTAVLSTALSVVRERERGTMEQIRVAPLRTAQLILGKTLPYLAISLLATVLILGAARVLFHVAVRGSYLDLLLATLLYLIGALGWGLLISTLADSQAIAFQIGIISSMLPALLMSGFIFPIRSMPPPLEFISHVVPARYYLVVLRGIILKGAGLAPYWKRMVSLGVYTLVVLSLASLRLARREA